MAEPKLFISDLITELSRLAPTHGHELAIVSLKLIVENLCPFDIFTNGFFHYV